MITYDSGHWAIGLIFSLTGSVLPKSLAWAFPSGVAAAAINYTYHRFYADVPFGGLINISSGYSIVLGFLLVFRAQIAYARFWDGASYLQTIRSGWLNATSNIFAFCSSEESKQEQVQKFQHQLVRLMSVMYSSVLQVVAGDCSVFEVLDYEGLDIHGMTWAQSQNEKLEIIMMWVQRLIVEQHNAGIISIAPPILSRVFQEFSNGMLDVSNAKRICSFPFPYPYAQMISLLLLAHLSITTMIGGFSMENVFPAFLYAFLSNLGIWSINYIAIEIEMPYGTDANDLPLKAMQKGMNDCLALYLHPMLKKPPSMADIQAHHLRVGLKPWKAPDKDHAVRVEQFDDHGEIQYALGDVVLHHNHPFDSRPSEPKTPKKTEKTEKTDKTEVKTQEEKAKPHDPAEDGLADVITNILQKQFGILADRINKHSEALAAELRHAARARADSESADRNTDPTVPEASHPTMPVLHSGGLGFGFNFDPDGRFDREDQERGRMVLERGRRDSRSTPVTSISSLGFDRILTKCGGGYPNV